MIESATFKIYCLGIKPLRLFLLSAFALRLLQLFSWSCGQGFDFPGLPKARMFTTQGARNRCLLDMLGKLISSLREA